MSKAKEKIFLFLSDFIFINLAWIFYYYIRIESGWIVYANPPSFLIPLIVIYIYWLIIFSFAGLYQHWFVRSRFDEFSSVFKTVSFGCFILFFIIFIDDYMNNAPIISRFLILIYWLLLVVCVSSGRIIIRSIQRNLLEKGIGLRNTLIIGDGEKAKGLKEMIEKYHQLGYKIIGSVNLHRHNGNSTDTDNESLGSLENIKEIITGKEISEILVALEPNEKEELIEVIRYCSEEKVNIKILPDMYEIVSGMAKTNQIYGVPLIEVMPDIMSPAGKLTKRIIDITFSVFTLILLAPVLLLVSILIKLDSKGPVFYRQVRVGRKGKEFTMIKFRSMTPEAEEYGPEWSGENDPRITRMGRILRKTYVDEIPQMINVLKNEMSLIGPRPERPYFVEQLKKEMPYYYKRLSVKPGITGWAQIKHKYDTSLEDVKTKIQYDFYYIENMSLKLDFKIMINTIIVILLMKGH
ncbi:MAG TPA: sugar transferase [Ignavibacteria bacterium]|nr:sugar transferase [Ignavibacteria bacterium]HMR40219.1 sugar transferase [Ignavibacteria bacterium]